MNFSSVTRLIYGLKQVPMKCNAEVDELMKAQVFSRNVYDSCFYMKKLNNDIFNFINLILYVNDMLILAKNQCNADRYWIQLKFIFEMKNIDKFKIILGMYIHKNLMKKKIWMSQVKYVQHVLDSFNMTNFKILFESTFQTFCNSMFNQCQWKIKYVMCSI